MRVWGTLLIVTSGCPEPQGVDTARKDSLPSLTATSDPVESPPEPDLELVAAAMGATVTMDEPIRVYLGRRPGAEEWDVLCREVTGATAEAAAALPVGTYLEVRGNASSLDRQGYPEVPMHRCELDSIVGQGPVHTPHLPMGLGPLWAAMSREAVAAALSLPVDEVPHDTDDTVAVVAGWGLVMEYGYLRFFATDADRVSPLAPLVATAEVDRRVNYLGNHMCRQPGWTGRQQMGRGWIDNEETGQRIVFGLMPLTKNSWSNSYVCGAARRLSAPGVERTTP